LSLVFLLVVPLNLISQDFLEGIYLYNRARYDSLIFQYSPAFIRQNPHEEGLARYFVAESYYNKALSATDSSSARQNFAKAWSEFARAIEAGDLKVTFPEFHDFAFYKMGWCSFRLAETSSSQTAYLQRAYREFREISPEAADSLKSSSGIMAGESLLRSTRSRFLRLNDDALSEEETSQLLSSLKGLNSIYDIVLQLRPSATSSPELPSIQDWAKIRKAAIPMYLGELFLFMPDRIFRQLPGEGQHASAINTAENYFSSVQLDSLDLASNSEAAKSLLAYLKSMKRLRLFQISHSPFEKTEFLRSWSQMHASDFEVERHFRRANLYHSVPDIESDDFNDLSLSYYDSAGALNESVYWAGHIRMVQGDDEESLKNFATFIKTVEKRPGVNPRQAFLLDDARYRYFLLGFESAYLTGQRDKLRELAIAVAQFSPRNRDIQEKTKQLNLLISCATTSNTAQIWSDALSGTDDEKLEQALRTIRFVLPRAALNIGMIREKYIRLLHRLFEITRNRRSNETLFFRGIVSSLEAEIEATPDAKVKRFRQAAEILGQIDSDFPLFDEAQYIRARGLFFAEDFEKARQLFDDLVNEHSALRALFYIAEIYRAEGDAPAARRCYYSIISNLENSSRDIEDFWLLNARAGLAALSDEETSSSIDSLQLEHLQLYSDANPDFLTYEQLAEERFLKRQYAREGVDLLIRYGLPGLEVHPSSYHLPHSRFENEIHLRSLFTLSEVRGPLTSSLRLTVLLPDGIDSHVQVRLGAYLVPRIDDVYIQPNIPLNSTLDLTITNPDCYTAHRHIHFARPSENRSLVALNRKLTFVATGATRTAGDAFQLADRTDRNVILKMLPELSLASQVKLDYQTRLEFRDVAFDAKEDRIIAIRSDSRDLVVYGTDPSSARLEPLKLLWADSLENPEGVAISGKGELFISDWGNHRIVVFDAQGRWLRQFGTFGRNSDESIESPVKLSFPTRLVIAEDVDGVEFDGKKHYRESYTYIADMNGIHKCKLDGTYLGTVIKPDDVQRRGGFYGFLAEGYGDEERLYLLNREYQGLPSMVEFAANKR
jgi:TolA-binding protein